MIRAHIPGTDAAFLVLESPEPLHKDAEAWLRECARRIARELRIAAFIAPPPRPKPKKKLGGAVAHHAKARRTEERQAEEVKVETWTEVLYRTRVDHRGRFACEACHHERELEPHHLELGAHGRRDAPEVVMGLCAECHRLGPKSAHRAPRTFAQTVVVPWARAHAFPLPNRKEYREP